MTAGPVTIVVPCHNEAKRLDPDAFVAAVDRLPPLRFLFVDDGSTDLTATILTDLGRARPEQVAVLTLTSNRGKGEAVRAGLNEAIAAEPWLVGFWDADLATPLDALDEFIALHRQRPELEMVLGSRVRLLGHDIRRHGRRHYLGRVAATAVSLILDLAVYDTQCGAKTFLVTDRLEAILGEPFHTRWVFDVEILARWLIAASPQERADVEERIVELPLPQWHDIDGTHITKADVFRAPIDIVTIRRVYGPSLRARPVRSGSR